MPFYHVWKVSIRVHFFKEQLGLDCASHANIFNYKWRPVSTSEYLNSQNLQQIEQLFWFKSGYASHFIYELKFLYASYSFNVLQPPQFITNFKFHILHGPITIHVFSWSPVCTSHTVQMFLKFISWLRWWLWWGKGCERVSTFPWS